MFSEAARGDIFKSFWDLGDKREQRYYITRHVEGLPAQRKRVGSFRKMMTFRYHLYTKESRVQVCRIFFLNTLDIGRDFVYGTMNMQTNSCVLNKVMHGTHSCHKKVDESSIQEVRDHIRSFASVDSHLSRATTSRKYLDPCLSISEMYRLYKEAYQEGNNVSEFIYRQVFDRKFNIGFQRPQKRSVRHMRGQAKKTKHQKDKEKSWEIMNLAKSQSKLPLKPSCAFDMQQILLCPHGLSSSFYYKRRLGVFNFTIYNFGDAEVLCYMWPETEARNGPNEVSTGLFDYIKDQVAKGKKEIHVFSDNCDGQNRNRSTAFAIWFARRHFNLDKMCHTFLEKGHMEIENGSIHATIERATRRIELYTPQQWYTVVRAARVSKQPYVVEEMLGEMFIDFKTMSNSVKNLSTYHNGERVMWSQTRQLVALKDDPNAINISTLMMVSRSG